MSDSDLILELYARRPADLTDEDLDKMIADLRTRRHTFNTTAKQDAGARPKPATKPKTEAGKAAQKLASSDLFKL